MSLVLEKKTQCWGYGIWRLVRERMEWEAVAVLNLAELARVAGGRAVRMKHYEIWLNDAYAVRDWVCCRVQAVVETLTPASGELVYADNYSEGQGLAMELHPHTFASVLD